MEIKKTLKTIGLAALMLLPGIEMPWDAPQEPPLTYKPENEAVSDFNYIVEINTPDAKTPAPEAEKDFIDEICEEYEIDSAILRAIIEIESDGDPDAVGDGGNSIGLCQVQEKWHSDRMARLGVVDLSDPYGNVLVACDYLSELLSAYGDMHMALTAYNAGTPYANTTYADRVLEIAYEQ